MNAKNLPFFLILLTFTACYYDNEVDLYGEEECQSDNSTYSGEVLPVLEQNCYVCHSENVAQGGVVLEGYDKLKVFVDNGRFWGAISHSSGFQPMPDGAPKLHSCTLEKINSWIEDGAINN